MKFEIESISFCRNGIAPQWTWWIRGVAGTGRYGVLGTDEQGMGLYLYQYKGDQTPERELLLDHHLFHVPPDTPKEEATDRLKLALDRLGWMGPPPGSAEIPKM